MRILRRLTLAASQAWFASFTIACHHTRRHKESHPRTRAAQCNTIVQRLCNGWSAYDCGARSVSASAFRIRVACKDPKRAEARPSPHPPSAPFMSRRIPAPDKRGAKLLTRGMYGCYRFASPDLYLWRATGVQGPGWCGAGLTCRTSPVRLLQPAASPHGTGRRQHESRPRSAKM